MFFKGDACNVASEDRTDCGDIGKVLCLQRGCCFDDRDKNTAFCFYKRGEEWKRNQTLLLQKIDELENNLISYNQTVQDLMNENDECKANNADCLDRLDDCQDDNSLHLTRIHELEANNTKYMNIFKELEANNTEYQDKIVELEANNTEYLNVIDQYKANDTINLSRIHELENLLLECQDPCSNEQCGPHSWCTVENNDAVCHCQQGFLGSPPNCEPECVQNSDCPSHEACVR